MEFCPDCSNLLTPQKDEKKKVLACLHCGYKKDLSAAAKNNYRIGEKIEHIPEKEELVVIDEELAQQKTMPSTRVVCPKCGHKEASYWQVQTRSGDEAMTTFYRCLKCKQTWREY